MNRNIFDVINNFTSITEEEYSHIAQKLNLTHFNRNENFIEIGQQNKVLGFLEKGLLTVITMTIRAMKLLLLLLKKILFSRS